MVYLETNRKWKIKFLCDRTNFILIFKTIDFSENNLGL